MFDLNALISQRVVIQLLTPYTVCGPTPHDSHIIGVATKPINEKLATHLLRSNEATQEQVSTMREQAGATNVLVGDLHRDKVGFYVEYDIADIVMYERARSRVYINPANVVAITVAMEYVPLPDTLEEKKSSLITLS